MGLIWYNMGLAAAHVPGYEFRAAALLRAYELEYGDGGFDPTIEGAVRSLEGTANVEIDALLQAAMASDHTEVTLASSESAACVARSAALYSAGWEAAAGHVAAANRLIGRAESTPGCAASPSAMRQLSPGKSMFYSVSSLARDFAAGGHLALAAKYAAMLDPQYIPFQFFQFMALSNIEFDHMTEARADERTALAEAEALQGSDANAWIYSAPEARLLYCVDTEWQWRTGISPDKDRARLADWRNLDYSRDRFPESRDHQLVLDAATYAAEGDYAWADVTAGALYDGGLRARWQGYRLPTDTIPTAHAQVMIPLEATDQITRALQGEPELLRCLGNSFFPNLLLRIGTGQVRFRSCPPSNATLASCMHFIESERRGVRTRAWHVQRLLAQVLRLRTTVFEHRWYEQSAWQQAAAGPSAPNH